MNKEGVISSLKRQGGIGKSEVEMLNVELWIERLGSGDGDVEGWRLSHASIPCIASCLASSPLLDLTCSSLGSLYNCNKLVIYAGYI